MGSLISGIAGGATVAITITAIDKFSKTFTSAQTSLTKFGKLGGIALAGIAIGTAALGVAAVKTASDFESAFAGVRKTSDLTEQEFSQLEQSFKDMSVTTGKTFEDLSAIGEIAGQLGVEGVDNLEKFTKTITDISVSTNLTAEAAATSFARIANIMGEPISNVDKMGSAVVDLGNNFATTESEIVNFATRIAGAGNIAGLTTQDTLAIGAAFSSVGVQAEAGGTAVQKVLIEMNSAVNGMGKEFVNNSTYIEEAKNVMSELSDKLSIATLKQSEFTDATKESTKLANSQKIDSLNTAYQEQVIILKQLEEANGAAMDPEKLKIFAETAGISAEKFATAWKDDAGQAFASFITGLGQQGDNAINTLSQLGLEDQRLVRSFLSLSNAGDLVTDTFDTANIAWDENTALVVEAEKRYDTFEQQMAGLKNGMRNFIEPLGKELIPLLLNLVTTFNDEVMPAITPLIPLIGDGLTKVIEKLAPYLPKLASAFMEIVEVAFEIFDAVEPLLDPLFDLGEILFPIILDVIKSLTPVVKSLAKALVPLLELLAPIVEFLGFIIGGISNIGGKALSFLAEGIGMNFDLAKNIFGVDDAIISPNGDVITTHPDDYLIATKNPQSLGGGGITLIIDGDIYGTDPDQMAEAFAEVLNKQIRI